jgi:hypothetical protein
MGTASFTCGRLLLTETVVHACKWNHTVFVLLFQTHFINYSVLRFIHVVAGIRTSFLLMANCMDFGFLFFDGKWKGKVWDYTVSDKGACWHLRYLMRTALHNFGARWTSTQPASCHDNWTTEVDSNLGGPPIRVLDLLGMEPRLSEGGSSWQAAVPCGTP